MNHRELRSPKTGSMNLLTASDLDLACLASENKIQHKVFKLRTPYMNVLFIQFLTHNNFEIRVVVKRAEQAYSTKHPKFNEFEYAAIVIPDINWS